MKSEGETCGRCLEAGPCVKDKIEENSKYAVEKLPGEIMLQRQTASREDGLDLHGHGQTAEGGGKTDEGALDGEGKRCLGSHPDTGCHFQHSAESA